MSPFGHPPLPGIWSDWKCWLLSRLIPCCLQWLGNPSISHYLSFISISHRMLCVCVQYLALWPSLWPLFWPSHCDPLYYLRFNLHIVTFFLTFVVSFDKPLFVLYFHLSLYAVCVQYLALWPSLWHSLWPSLCPLISHYLYFISISRRILCVCNIWHCDCLYYSLWPSHCDPLYDSLWPSLCPSHCACWPVVLSRVTFVLIDGYLHVRSP